MRIIQVIDTLNIGGAERMCVNISNLLTSKSVENSIIVTRKLGPLSKQVDLDCIDLISKKHGLDFVAFYRFFKIIKNRRPDVMHAHSTSIYWVVLLKILYPNLKLVWHDHEGMSGYLREDSRKLIKNISRFFDSVLVVNQILLEWNLKNLKTKEVYFLRNFSLFKKKTNQKNNEVVRIVCLANFREQKDHMTLFKALTLIPDDIIFECVCAGHVSDMNYFNLLRIYCKQNLENKVIFPGEIEDVEQLLLSADIGVLSSKSEGLPVALLEYGCAGLPVIATQVGQCGQVLGNGSFGKLIEMGNFVQLAQELELLIKNRSIRIKIGKDFKQHIESQYGSELFYENYIRIIG
jgi:glycosyltransferase involved in cell wall biosynthesis